MTLGTIHKWLRTFGWRYTPIDDTTIAIFRDDKKPYVFLLRVSPNWLLLKIIPAVPTNAAHPIDLARRLLAVNRDIRLAKYGYEKDGVITMAAELPVESLQPSQLRDIIERMPRFIDHYRDYLAAPSLDQQSH